jgi:hypothetical protein
MTPRRRTFLKVKLCWISAGKSFAFEVFEPKYFESRRHFQGRHIYVAGSLELETTR